MKLWYKLILFSRELGWNLKSAAQQKQQRRFNPCFMIYFVLSVWVCGSLAVLSCVHSFESICPHQRACDGLKWKSSVGQCENIHTHAGVELTQRGVSKWAAFMLTPEAAAVSPHLQSSSPPLIGEMTLVYMDVCFHMKWPQPGLLTRCVCKGGGSVTALVFPYLAYNRSSAGGRGKVGQPLFYLTVSSPRWFPVASMTCHCKRVTALTTISALCSGDRERWKLLEFIPKIKYFSASYCRAGGGKSRACPTNCTVILGCEGKHQTYCIVSWQWERISDWYQLLCMYWLGDLWPLFIFTPVLAVQLCTGLLVVVSLLLWFFFFNLQTCIYNAFFFTLSLVTFVQFKSILTNQPLNPWILFKTTGYHKLQAVKV